MPQDPSAGMVNFEQVVPNIQEDRYVTQIIVPTRGSDGVYLFFFLLFGAHRRESVL